MENMFKRTLLCAAISAAAMASTGANAAIDLMDGKVQVYGQAAGAIFIDDNDNGTNAAFSDMESRIGFRGVVEFDNFAPDIVWQIESGNANGASGSFGVRDTYIGLAFDNVGSIKWGRQLQAAYNYVDWPHSNPGLGNVFDWNNDITAAGNNYLDRADNTLRFDSVSWNGVGVQATLSGMGSDTDAMVSSIAANYAGSNFGIHAGYYHRGDYTTSTKVDAPFIKDDVNDVWIPNPDYGTTANTKYYANSYAIVGGNVSFGDVTLTAAYKYMMQDTATGDADQNAFSATAQYVAGGTWLYKLGYAATTDADIDGNTAANTADTAITGRIGYLLPSAIIYSDIRHYDMNDNVEQTRFLLGVEYYF
ncbi:porin [Photobacterium phosphoreum]|uniref:porin n=1 Tax=Photobacterium phosphoreum TaxID=659 RepID=UPI000D164C3E|nr:porin [Photobacterium phosphoreum]PSU71209.1 porin [Photobacterium phosphoreum]PSW35281.1 porin [Photobacterium phosphoreum]